MGTDAAEAVNLLAKAAQNAVDSGCAGVMVVVTDGQTTKSIPVVSEQANPHVVSLWMLGAHIRHLVDSAHEAGGEVTMEQAAKDAISFVEEYEAVEDAG